MEWRPNKLIAVLLALFTQFLGMLYVGRVGWAVFYFLAPLAVFGTELLFSASWLQYFSFTFVIAIICALHVYWIAATFPAVTVRPWYSRWYGLIAIYLVYAIAVLLLRAFFYEPFRMPSSSMFPTIKAGSHMVVAKYGYGNYEAFGLDLMQGEMTADVGRGDLLVFQSLEDASVPYVKRVVGLPGDTIRFQDRQLFINGKPVVTRDLDGSPDSAGSDESFHYVMETFDDVSHTVVYIPGRERYSFEVSIPEENYFVMGDNRDNSRDSRYFGFVPEENLIGKVIYVTSNGSFLLQ